MTSLKYAVPLLASLLLGACGGGGSGCNPLLPLASCKDDAANAAPVAVPGANRSVVTLSNVNLDGSASTDANNDKLTYLWTLESKPAGSALVWSAETAKLPAPTFKPDVSGNYVLGLVVSDGRSSSQKVEVTITATAANLPPVASAGSNQSVTLVSPMAPVILDASGSSDPNMDTLTYVWKLEDPNGDAVELDDDTSPKPEFTPLLTGTYIADLVVSDTRGGTSSARTRVVVSRTNSAPVASAGLDQSVITGAKVTLSGLGSTDADGNTLTYKWSLNKPSGSTATLLTTVPEQPTFVADLDGTYTASLVVFDGKVDSVAISTVRVTAGPLNVAPVALAAASPTTVSLAALAPAKLVTLDGGGSTDGNGDVLTYTWVLTSFPGATAPTLTVDPLNRAKSTFTPAVAGSYVATLVVSDGKLTSQLKAGSTVVVTATP
jgi:hypothetical protein